VAVGILVAMEQRQATVATLPLALVMEDTLPLEGTVDTLDMAHTLLQALILMLRMLLLGNTAPLPWARKLESLLLLLLLPHLLEGAPGRSTMTIKAGLIIITHPLG